MSQNKNIELVFAEWNASLKKRDKTAKSLRPNFEELFSRWKSADASREDIYEIWLPKAISAHNPTSSVVRTVYKRLKTDIRGFDKTEKEFEEHWRKTIADIATEVFFEYFPLSISVDDDTEPKVYGSMSAKEYGLQRRYIEQYPILDTTELEKQWREQQYNLDIEEMLRNVLGDKK